MNTTKKKSQLLTDTPSKGDPRPGKKLLPEKPKAPLAAPVEEGPLLPKPTKPGRVL